MAFSARHEARRASNALIAGALLAFCGCAYAYTMTRVRRDEIDDAIEARERKRAGR